MIVLVAVIVGLGAGLLAGGNIRSLALVRFRWERGLMALFLVQLLLPLVRLGGAASRVVYFLWLFTIAASALAALVNWRVPGLPCIALGLLLNGVVVAANGGMPVLPEAAQAAGGAIGSWLPAAGDYLHVVAGRDTLMIPLADVVPVPWPLPSIASAGDVLMVTGLGAAVASMTRTRRTGD